jgi:16S rRNA (cytosine967-C5)-methyltransferase
VSVAPARRAAFEVVRRTFEHQAWADRALRSAVRRHQLGARERGMARHLAYGAVQRRGTCDHLVERLAGRPVGELDAPVRAALRLGLFELLFADATPDHAAVDQAVELAKGGGGTRRRAAAGLVNALLRRAARERTELLGALDDATPAGAAVAHSYPEWLARMWWDELGGAEARSLMAAMNVPAETSLRVNTIKADPDRVLAELQDEGEPVSRPAPAGLLAQPEALVVRGPLGEVARRRLAQGELVGQSRGSQAVTAVLDPQPTERVLDLCAAPGIKTTGIAARMRNSGELVAVEANRGRARELRELCARLGVECVRVIEGDAASDDVGGGYDRVLVDPPCSDLGTLASRPDARWRKSPELVERLAALQGRILVRASAAVRPGGRLVYATCTLSRRENEDRARDLLSEGRSMRPDGLDKAHPELASGEPGSLCTRPDRDGTDGFFIARLNRTEAGASSAWEG